MKEIVVDARMIRHSGIGVYLRELLKIVKDKISITCLVPSSGLTFVENNQLTYIIDNSPIYSLVEQINLIRYDRNKVFWFPNYNVPIFLLFRRKTVVTIHDAYPLAYFNELGLLKKVYAKLFYYLVVRNCSKIITVSDFSKNEILKYTNCDSSKIQVIYNGVRQVSSVKSFSVVSHRYCLPDKYLLFVGNVKPNKNIKRFLEAFLLLDSDIRAAYKVVIVGKIDGFITGDPALYKWIKSAPQLYDNVVFTGFVDDDDLDTIYSGASLFVFPSIYEGFGMPPLEAMLNRCPVIVSQVASLPEICGDAALYFNPFDAQDMCNKMKAVLTDSKIRGALIENGAKKVKEYTWERSAFSHLKVFDDCLANI